MNPATAFGTVVLDELIAGGLTDVVLSPGSRSAPLAMAAAAADRAGRIRLHVRFDERTAGFLALGLAKASGRPVAVITTSGTAAANLHPAVVEADLAEVPLLLLTADRPPWLRDVGANQVIDQVRLFGSGLRYFHEFEVPTRSVGQNARWRSMVCRALSHGAGSRPGPVHLNVCLDDPLLPDADQQVWPESLVGRTGPWTEIAAGAEDAGRRQSAPIAAPGRGERVLVVADLEHPLAEPLAAAGHLVISEAGGAAGTDVLDAGLHLLGQPEFVAAHRPERVIVLGRPTLLRSVTALLTDPTVAVEVVSAASAWRDFGGNVARVGSALAPHGQNQPDGWHRAWTEGNRAVATAVGRRLEAAPLAWSVALARALAAGLGAGDQLILGSSQPARDLGLGAAARSRLTLRANRGAAGIDGTVSTAIGAALAAPGQRTAAYLGDLTLLHDATGLFVGPHEPRPDLTVVVSNNDGGGIFATLESGDPAHQASFERVFGTPHGADLGALAAAAGHEYRLISNRDELRAALARPHGIRLVEVRTDRLGLRDQLAVLRATTRRTLGG